jgi:hypothetical protein
VEAMDAPPPGRLVRSALTAVGGAPNMLASRYRNVSLLLLHDHGRRKPHDANHRSQSDCEEDDGERALPHTGRWKGLPKGAGRSPGQPELLAVKDPRESAAEPSGDKRGGASCLNA